MQVILALKIECVVKGNRENTKQITHFMFTKSLNKNEGYMHWKVFNKTCNFDNNLNTDSLCRSISAGISQSILNIVVLHEHLSRPLKTFKK